ncbi:hypothetical protein [Bradyrhizobium liaoningense]
MEKGPYLVAGNPEDVAKALIDGKPASKELRARYARCLREEITELAKEHAVPHTPMG